MFHAACSFVLSILEPAFQNFHISQSTHSIFCREFGLSSEILEFIFKDRVLVASFIATKITTIFYHIYHLISLDTNLFLSPFR